MLSDFDTPHFNHFTTANLINISPLVTPTPLFIHPKFKAFVQQKPGVIPTISNSVVDSLRPVPEPSYLSCSAIFDGWFGIPFKVDSFTNIRSPHSTDILRLYGLSCLIPLYPCIFSQHKSEHWFCTSFHLEFHTTSKIIIFDDVPSAIPPLPHLQCISNCFTLQPLPAKHDQEKHINRILRRNCFLIIYL